MHLPRLPVAFATFWTTQHNEEKCLVTFFIAKLGVKVCVARQVQRELQERAKFEITGTRVLRQKLKKRFRVVKQAHDHSQVQSLLAMN